MNTERIAVIDLETTGKYRSDRIVEIAIVVISPDGEVHDEYDTLVNPERDIGPTWLHKISAAEAAKAPTFASIAGDVMELLAGASVVAGHKIINFDRPILAFEYKRLGVFLPDLPLLDTFRAFPMNLQACCRQLGISFEGQAHRALSDARATAQIVALTCSEYPEMFHNARSKSVLWPKMEPLRTRCFRREDAHESNEEPTRIVQRLAAKLHHGIEAAPTNVLEYEARLDRILEDRVIDGAEEKALEEAALQMQISPAQLEDVHRTYLRKLASSVLADGIVSKSEYQDLALVARLLGVSLGTLDGILESPDALLVADDPEPAKTIRNKKLHGQRVCFTGELQSTIDGERITRDFAQALAERAGLIVTDRVTKKLDILVVADPNTQSGKAKNARKYGIRMLADRVFWQALGIAVD